MDWPGLRQRLLTVTEREADEAAGALVTVFTTEVDFAETSTGEVLTGTVGELGITLATCRKTHGQPRRLVALLSQPRCDSREQANGESMVWSGDL